MKQNSQPREQILSITAREITLLSLTCTSMFAWSTHTIAACAGGHQLRVHPRGEQVTRHVLDYWVLDPRIGNHFILHIENQYIQWSAVTSVLVSVFIIGCCSQPVERGPAFYPPWQLPQHTITAGPTRRLHRFQVCTYLAPMRFFGYFRVWELFLLVVMPLGLDENTTGVVWT